MKKYVALLRGVNVGGKRRVSKLEFQEILESMGFRDVVTYINSGNAIFSSEQVPVTSEVQLALENHFGFAIATLILPAERIIAIAAAIPPEWKNDGLTPEKTGQKSDVVYLFDEIDTPAVLELIRYNPDIETMLRVEGAILANISRANQVQGSLQRLIGSPLYQQMTIRNITTAKKLAELVK